MTRHQPAQLENPRFLELAHTYCAELEKWNRHKSLSSIKPERYMDMLIVPSLYFLESVAPDSKRVLDIGTGAGIPGLIMAMADPSREYVLADRVQKKISFVKSSIRKLGISNVSAICGDIAELTDKLGGRFNTAVTRAVADITALIKLADPTLTPQGEIIALKGTDSARKTSATTPPDGYSVLEPREYITPEGQPVYIIKLVKNR